MHKTWNVRDQTDEELNAKLQEQYRLIERDYKLLRKMPEIEGAKKVLESIYSRKTWINSITNEQLRRLYNGTSI